MDSDNRAMSVLLGQVRAGGVGRGVILAVKMVVWQTALTAFFGLLLYIDGSDPAGPSALMEGLGGLVVVFSLLVLGLLGFWLGRDVVVGVGASLQVRCLRPRELSLRVRIRFVVFVAPRGGACACSRYAVTTVVRSVLVMGVPDFVGLA